MSEKEVSSERNRLKLQEDFSRRTFIKRSGYALAGTMLVSQGALAVCGGVLLLPGLPHCGIWRLAMVTYCKFTT